MDTEYLRTYAQSADENTLASGLPLTDGQKRLIAMVDEVGPTWAQRAFKHDREAIFPTENWNDLRKMGFLGLCVPTRYGGMGADYRTYMLVASRIGYYCGSTANTFSPRHTPECYNSCFELGPDWNGPYMGFKHVELTVLGHLFEHLAPTSPLKGMHYERFLYSRGVPMGAVIEGLSQACADAQSQLG
ncbi:MAG: acyl-CoA dehydrogenase family protein, partial [Betaproteobacteria bacterium]|nr:acyl-CoA dehydrogenase family protein [Betaproteobacteria bacterium]